MSAAFWTLPAAGEGKVIAGEFSTFQMVMLVACSTECKGAFLLIFLGHVSHLVFLDGKTELLVLLLKKSRISLFAREASGKTD